MYNKIKISGKIKVVTGMHIGGSSAFSAIGAVDSPVIRDKQSDLPMIPGTTLKGKLRTLMAKGFSDSVSAMIGKHDDDPEIVLRLFGNAKKTVQEHRNSRLIFSDMILSNMDELKQLDIHSATEVKFENSINRLTAVANPRQIERVIRGSEFELELIYNVEDETQIQEDFEAIRYGLTLLEYDYLGGSGSRGYGKVKFEDLQAENVIGNLSDEVMQLCNEILCHEALGISEGIEKLVHYCKSGKLKLSDGLPYIDDTLYVPKPMTTVETKEEGNSKVKKAFKKLKYIPINKIEEYMKGNLDAQKEKEKLSRLGKYEMTQKASISYEEGLDALPYYIGSYHFSKNAGLYVIIGYEDTEAFQFISSLIEGLSYSGIGGKRTSGYGKFQAKYKNMDPQLKQRLNVPKDDEIEKVCTEVQFQLIKRSGFVNSMTYADTFRKKKDFYGFVAGSCFKIPYQGDIYDVSIYGKHPVYRYAIPIFMGVI
jgi:CRISPR type III-A-associated RAMP protein Csm3/CRISPR type III-A-associated RAMP protein Csm4